MNRRALALAAAGSLGLLPLAAHAVRPVHRADMPEVVDAGPPPEAAEPEAHKPVAPKKPVEAQKPKLNPSDVIPPPMVKPQEPKKIENPAEVTYKQKVADHAFTLHVRPGNPKPGAELELVVEIARLHDPPDPTYGDREPERDADLVLTLDKGHPTTPVVLHALGEPGVYGAHVSAFEQGLYQVRISRRSGKPGLDASFPLGVGVPTPARPDDVLATLPSSTRSGRTIVGAESASSAPALPTIMRELAQHLLATDAALEGKGDARAEAHAMVELSKAIAGQTPPHASNRPKEFDAEAAGLTSALQQLESNPSAARLADVEKNHCWRCHVQYRWGVASDVSAWPAFTQEEVK